MLISIVILLASLAVILLFCTVFVNAIECFGQYHGLHQGIVGSILAAVGTALPETLIPIIAILFSSGESAHDIGIGAIAGATFMLSTLGFFVTGSAVIVYRLLGKRGLEMSIDGKIMSKDLLFFLVVYGIAIVTTFFSQIVWLKISIAIILILSYSIYLKLVISGEHDMVENVDELYLAKYLHLNMSSVLIVIQVLAALSAIVIGAHFFIIYVEKLSAAIGISPLVLSILITPIATELPEKLNSVIWVGRKKDTLALGNITGAMVFQCCFPVAFGMIATPWKLQGATLVSAFLALGSGLLTFFYLKVFKNIHPFVLLIGGIFYTLFLIHVFR